MIITVTDREGIIHHLEALDGWRVMEVIRDWGLSLTAECGGACSCATCHIYVEPAWLNRLPPPLPEELEKLDEAYDVRANSRLSCQILCKPEIDGLALTLAPEMS
jgi:ferredoxin, 2Fe-2S